MSGSALSAEIGGRDEGGGPHRVVRAALSTRSRATIRSMKTAETAGAMDLRWSVAKTPKSAAAILGLDLATARNRGLF